MIALLLHMFSRKYRQREADELDAREKAVFEYVMLYERMRHRE